MSSVAQSCGWETGARQRQDGKKSGVVLVWSWWVEESSGPCTSGEACQVLNRVFLPDSRMRQCTCVFLFSSDLSAPALKDSDTCSWLHPT